MENLMRGMYSGCLLYTSNEALYPFGYGLSYTTYAYGNLECVKPFDAQDGITLQVTVTNTGDREGTETLQVYVKADVYKRQDQTRIIRKNCLRA